MVIRNLNLDMNILEILKYLEIETSDNGVELVISEQKNKGLYIKKNGNNVKITYSERVLLFRALGLLKERCGLKDFEFSQASVFEGNGLMIDCSRNAVTTVDTIKTIIKQLALMGHNTFMLYTEDTYEIEGEPFFGYMRGRYTKDELKQVDDYAYGFGIEVVPCIQTLAHLPCSLRWRAYSDLKDIDDILCADYDETYELIEKMIKTCSDVFRSNRIHIGMDEAGNLGRGKYKNINGNVESIEIMCRHLSKVIEICNKFEFNPMLWNDMFFTLAGDGYSPQSGINSSLLEHIPQNVSMVYWDYYAKDKKIYDDNINKQIGLPNELIFAGGAWRWSGYATGLYYSMQVSRLALQSCFEHGVKKIFTTAWGDNGSDASFYSMMPVVQLFAEFGFNPEITDEELAIRFKTCTGGDIEDFLSLDIPDMVEGTPDWAAQNPSKYLLFQDPLSGIFDKHSSTEFDSYYKKSASKLYEIANKGGDYSYIFEAMAALCDVLEIKASIGVKLKQAYDDKDMSRLRQLAENDLLEIAKRAEKFGECIRVQWFNECKGFGFEVQDIRIAGVSSRAKNSSKRVLDYVNSKIEKIEELEAERLYYDNRNEDKDKKITDCNTWSYIVTGGII